MAHEVAQALAAGVDDAVERVGRDVLGADGRLERGAQVGGQRRLGDVELVEADRARGDASTSMSIQRSRNGPSSGLSACVKATSSSPQPHHFIRPMPRPPRRLDASTAAPSPDTVTTARDRWPRGRPAAAPIGPPGHGRASAAMPEWGMVDHREPSAGALAHGAAKSSDIARVRRDLGAAQIGAAAGLAARGRPAPARRAAPAARSPGRTPAPASSARAAGGAHAAQHHVDVLGLRPARPARPPRPRPGSTAASRSVTAPHTPAGEVRVRVGARVEERGRPPGVDAADEAEALEQLERGVDGRQREPGQPLAEARRRSPPRSRGARARRARDGGRAAGS